MVRKTVLIILIPVLNIYQHINLYLDCNVGRCDDDLGHCVIGIYDETKGCDGKERTTFRIKEKATPSK